MLEVLDPEQNRTFRDHYLDLPFDLSKTLFICTANTLDTIPGPLLDRMDVISLSGYTEDEKLGIAKRYLVPEAAAGGTACDAGQLALPDKVLRTIIREYTREAGVRNLERRIADVCRKAATEIATGRATKVKVDDEHASRLARPAPVRGRGAQAHLGAGSRDRARVHDRRRRHPVHRGDRVPGQGRADDHRPARRGDAGVRAGGAVVGAGARRSAGPGRGLVRDARRAYPRAGRSDPEGRPVGRRDDGDSPRLTRPQRTGR